MFFWNSFAFLMIQWMLAIWSLVPLPFLKPAWTSGSSRFTHCWSLTWRLSSITLLVSWETCMQFRKQQLELDMEQQTGSKSGKEYVKGLYCHPAYLTYMQGSDWFSHTVVPNYLGPHELQHARSPCPSPTPGVHPNPCPSSRWCHPTISSSVVPFSSRLQSFPASGAF